MPTRAFPLDCLIISQQKHFRPEGMVKNTQAEEKQGPIQPRLIYPARLSFKIEEEIKSFPDKRKLKEFVTTKPILQQMLKGLL